jgi:hypothetical protein
VNDWGTSIAKEDGMVSMWRSTARHIAILATVMLAVALSAQRLPAQATEINRPTIDNARVEKRTLSEPLASTLKTWAAKATQPQWIGYSVPQVAGDHQVCCSGSSGSWNQSCGPCRLEDSDHGITMNSHDTTARLEAPRGIAILFRAEHNVIGKIRVVSEDCTLDAGGLPIVWLTNVRPSESVAVLIGYVHGENFEEGEDTRTGREALTAIALHADDSADHALESFVRPDERESLRRQASFWLGEARGKFGLVALQRMAKSDPSSEVRSQVTFALSISREPAAIDEMIRVAHDDESAHVRGQALFWLAQKAGKKAGEAITGAIANDPDTEVKKKAVFALSQMPKDEGVPKLIEVAQTNRNPAVRKQAMFWLGQSNDPRALAFFEKVLTQ